MPGSSCWNSSDFSLEEALSQRGLARVLVRLLIVEDDRRARRALSGLLVAMGHTVVATSSTKRALDQLDREQFDLIFAGLRTRRRGGMEPLKTLRQRWPETPVVVLAGPRDRGAAADPDADRSD